MKRIVLFVACCFLTAPSFAESALAPRVVGPVTMWSAADADLIDSAWLHVKFVEGMETAIAGDRFTDPTLDLSPVNAALQRARAVEVRRTFPRERALLREWKQAGELQSGATGPDLSLWFDVRVEGGPAQVTQLVNELNACAAVEIAHPAPRAESAVLRTESHLGASSAHRGGTPDFTEFQDYLYDAPVGLEGPAAWALPGGTGEGLQFIDVELCWTENHEDFNFANHFYLGGAAENPQYEPHGTAVLGEVIGQHNGFGIHGFAPDVLYGMVAILESEWPSVPHRFMEALSQLDPGDVWLIELQTPQGLPMEYYQVNYDVIWTGCWSLGIVCVEAAGNGSNNLDSPGYGGIFDRSVRDSGAIMVAAGTPFGLVAEGFSSYGSRIDAHAWGSQIVTTGYGDLYTEGPLQTRYTANFGGTSGASPMVTGAAICLQGIALANLSHRLTPLELRTLITETGTPHQGTRLIGPRPNLEAAIAELLDAASAPESASARALKLVVSPNPFHAASEIRFAAPEAGAARVDVFDASGRQVRALWNGAVSAGSQVMTWDGRDDAGQATPSGVYYVRIRMNDGVATRSVQRIR